MTSPSPTILDSVSTETQSKQPGLTEPMEPKPLDKMGTYIGRGLFEDQVVVITGGDSGIGRATSIAFAKEGAHIVILYLSEHSDAEETVALVEAEGRRALALPGDVGDPGFARRSVVSATQAFGGVHVLCNNAAEQHYSESIESIDESQLLKTFRTNIFSCFYMAQACLPYLKHGGSIINVSSVTAYKGNESLVDYSASKGAMVSFTRSLSLQLAPRGIRVNAVAPGPIWTPLIPATLPQDRLRTFGDDVPLGGVGQPDHVAPAIIYLASHLSSFVTGQVIHVNGGIIVNG